MTVTIRTRRDIAANWTTANPVLALGEKGVETDTLKEKVGDGATAWADLPYFNEGSGGGADLPPGNIEGQLVGWNGTNQGYEPQGNVFLGANDSLSVAGKLIAQDAEIVGLAGNDGAPVVLDADGNLGAGAFPPPGDTLPPGGTTDQVLTKLSNADGDADWADAQGGGPGETGEFYLQEEITSFSGTSASIQLDIPNPADYEFIEIVGTLNSLRANSIDTINIYVNGDLSNANYNSQRNVAQNGTNNTTQGDQGIAQVPGASISSDEPGLIWIRIENPGPGKLFNAIGFSGNAFGSAANRVTGTYTVAHETDTSGVNQINLTGFVGDDLVGELRVLGTRKVAVNAVLPQGETGEFELYEELARFSGNIGAGVIQDFPIANAANYDEIEITLQARSAGAVDATFIRIYFNGDSNNANYSSQYLYGRATTASPAGNDNVSYAGLISAGNAPAGAYMQSTIKIQNPNSGKLLSTSGVSGGVTAAAIGFSGTFTMHHKTLTDLTSIGFYDNTNQAMDADIIIRGRRKVQVNTAMPTIPVQVWEEIASLQATQPEFSVAQDFSDYDELRFVGTCRSTAANTNAGLGLNFNGEVNTNLNSQVLFGSAASPQTISYANNNVIGLVSAAQAPTNSYTPIDICIQKPNGPQKKAAQGQFGFHQVNNATIVTGIAFCESKTLTDPITQVRIGTSADCIWDVKLIGRRTRQVAAL